VNKFKPPAGKPKSGEKRQQKYARPAGSRPAFARGPEDREKRTDAPRGARPPFGSKPSFGAKPPFKGRTTGDGPPREARFDRPAGARPTFKKSTDYGKGREDAPRSAKPAYGRGPQDRDDKPRGARPPFAARGDRDDKPRGARPPFSRPPQDRDDKPRSARPPFGRPPQDRDDKPRSARPPFAARGDRDDKPRGARPPFGRPPQDRDDKPRSARPPFAARGDRDDKPRGARPPFGRPPQDRDDKPRSARPPFAARGDRDDKPRGARPPFGRPPQDRDDKPRSARPPFAARGDRDDKPRSARPPFGRDREDRDEKPRAFKPPFGKRPTDDRNRGAADSFRAGGATRPPSRPTLRTTLRTPVRPTLDRKGRPPVGNKPQLERDPQKTLERVLSKAGLGSRTDARSWIGAGRVHVNGKLIQTPDHWVDIALDKVTLDGKPVVVDGKENRYIVLYKPKGFLTTAKDPEGRPTVYDLLKDVGQYLVPVGRLDLDSTGLLFLTNDTKFADFVTSPESHIAKTYMVKASKVLTDEQLDQLRNGIELDDGMTRPAIVTRVRDAAKYSFIDITITEGRNRQVRRMIEALDAKVLKLVRTAIGPIKIEDLEIGTYRELSEFELRTIRGAN